MKRIASTGLIGFLLGVLASFSVWAVAWGVSAHSDVVLGATDSSTVLRFAYHGVKGLLHDQVTVVSHAA